MAFPTVPTLPFVPGTDSIPSSVLNAWRTFFPSCLDADGGGTYTNTAPIIFASGSAGWQFGAGVTVLGTGFLTVAVGATLTVSGAMTASGAATFTGAVAINSPGSLTLGAGVNLLVGGNATVTGTLGVTGNTTLSTVSAAGPITVTGSQPSASTNPGADNRIYATNIAKAWGTVDFDNGVVTVSDGYNVSGGSISINVQGNITFVRAMANANYAVLLSGRRGAGAFIEYPLLLSKSTTGFSLNIRDLSAAGVPINLDANHPGEVHFVVYARQ